MMEVGCRKVEPEISFSEIVRPILGETKLSGPDATGRTPGNSNFLKVRSTLEGLDNGRRTRPDGHRAHPNFVFSASVREALPVQFNQSLEV